jgi:hypothetical protein
MPAATRLTLAGHDKHNASESSMRLNKPSIFAAGAIVLAAVLPLLPTSALAQASVTREVAYTYDPNTGQLLSETVDPEGSSHCVRTTYGLDAYGNRQTITTQACGNNDSAKKRVTVNSFDAKDSFDARQKHPAGAFLTGSASGDGSLTPNNLTTAALSRSTATHDVALGAPLSQTTVALADAGRNLTKRSHYDSLGRPRMQEVPVSGANGASATYSRVHQKTVYCRGALGPSGATTESALADAARALGCIHYTTTVAVNYDSGRLVARDANGNWVSTNQAQATAIGAYYIESWPTDSADQPIGAKSRVHYDSLHREIAKESQTYSGQWSMSLTVYDNVGCGELERLLRAQRRRGLHRPARRAQAMDGQP